VHQIKFYIKYDLKKKKETFVVGCFTYFLFFSNKQENSIQQRGLAVAVVAHFLFFFF